MLDEQEVNDEIDIESAKAKKKYHKGMKKVKEIINDEEGQPYNLFGILIFLILLFIILRILGIL